LSAEAAPGKIGGDAVKAVLQRLLQDRAGEVREAALKAIGSAGQPIS
jgi:HEAT repeat protein